MIDELRGAIKCYLTFSFSYTIKLGGSDTGVGTCSSELPSFVVDQRYYTACLRDKALEFCKLQLLNMKYRGHSKITSRMERRGMAQCDGGREIL